MAKVQITVTIYQMKEELIRTPYDNINDRLTELASQNKLITITKNVTVNNIAKIEALYSLQDFNDYLSQFRNETYPYIRGEVQFEEVA